MSHHIVKKMESSPIQHKWIECRENNIAGERNLHLTERYSVIVVLKGGIEITFNRLANQQIGEHSLVVVDKQQIALLKWQANTVLLEFTPPKKMFHYFTSSHPSLQPPCSTILPVRPLLQQWIDDLMKECQQPAERLSLALRRAYCARLGNILKTYPPLQVHQLLFPFLACSASGEAKCNGELFT